MKKEKQNWEDLDNSRSILLSQTNWTQLENSGLDIESKERWREWRKVLTSINRNNYDSIDQAFEELVKLRNSLPDLQYPEKSNPLIIENYHPINRDMIKDIVREIMSESSNDIYLDDVNDLSLAKTIAQKELKSIYKAKLKNVSPPTETFQLYIERLNQAVDYLSNNGTAFPLLDVLVRNMKKNAGDIALDILKHHTSMISSFVIIEETYLQSLKAINDSGTIGEIKSILERFNGH